MTNKEIAQKTKQLIEEHGWFNLSNNKVNFVGNDPKAAKECIGSALFEVTNWEKGRDLRKPFLNAINKKLNLIDWDFDETKHIGLLFSWNDSQTSVEAIYNLLDSIED